MERNGVSFENLRDTVRNLDGYHIHVVGDTIVDAYTRTTLIEARLKHLHLVFCIREKINILVAQELWLNIYEQPG